MEMANKLEQVKSTSEYWRHRRENAKYAKDWVRKMESLYSPRIKDEINNSVIYDENSEFFSSKTYSTPSVEVVKTDSVSAVIRETSNTSNFVCVLNFASYKEPGGKFIDGSIAQEECLCRESTLYNVLSSDKLRGYYESNCMNKNKALYLNRAIYTPNVLFVRDDKEYKCDVLTCAAPNYSAAKTYCNVSSKQNHEVLKSRIEFVLDIMEKRAIDVPILGAFGCGVFGQDAKEVAQVFKEALNTGKYHFTKVVFAVIPGPNADDFEEVFQNGTL